MANKKVSSGFTLVEILLVVVIIGIMTALVVPNIAGRIDQARLTAAEMDVQANLALALDLYKMDNGFFPTSEQGLVALVKKPTTEPVPVHWRGPYLKKNIPRDPWKRPYVYRAPGNHNPEYYDLFSFGPDGKESSDDVGNWDAETSSK